MIDMLLKNTVKELVWSSYSFSMLKGTINGEVNMKKLLVFLKTSVAAYHSLVICIVLAVVVSFCGTALPEVLRQGIDRVSAFNLPGLFQIGWIALALTVLTVIVDAVLKLNKRHYINSCEQGWQLRLVEKHIDIKKSALHEWSAGDVITVIISNVMDGVNHSTSAVLAFATGCSLLLFSVVYMGILSPTITLCLIGYNVLFRIAAHFAERGIKKSAARLAAVNKENNSFLTALLNNMLLVRVYEQHGFFKGLLQQKESNTLKTGVRRSAWDNGLMDGTWAFAKIAEFVLIYGLGGWLVFHGKMPIGNLIAFVFALDLFVKGIDSFAIYLSEKNNAVAQIEAVEKLFHISEIENESLLPLSNAPFAVKLEDVSFGYGKEPLLEHISLVINPGDKVLIKGPNGQGKSTLLKLISGLYRPNSGKVLYGSVAASDCHLSGLSVVRNVISQQNDLLEGTVPENVALDVSPNHDRIAETLAVLNLQHIENSLPLSLSQGEKQRLNIGRALYKSEALLILGDEIFANIDRENARKIEEELASCWGKLTVLCVAHEAMQLPFNRVLSVSEGSVTEEAFL